MAKATITIEQVRPNLWIVLDEHDPESGTLVRRVERWTCTCAAAECAHIAAARSLIAKASHVAKAIDGQEIAEGRGIKSRARRANPPSPDSADPTDEFDSSVTFTMLPSRTPRKVRVSDRSVLRLSDEENAA